MKTPPYVISVVTICYNCVNEIRATLESVVSQTYPNVDYVIIDGASTDGTTDIVKEYTERIATIVSEPDKGIYNAMNKGLAHCKGDYVVFMNAGDVFADNDVLSNVVRQIEESGTAPDLVYGTYMENNSGVVVPNRSHKKCWYGMFASHQSMFYNLSFLKEHHISYDESFRIAADYKLTLRVVHEGRTFLKIPTCIASFDTNGISCNNPQLGMDEACRARKDVLGYNKLQNLFVVTLIKAAHSFRRNFSSIYKVLRYK